MKSSKFLSFLGDTSYPKSVFSLFLPTSLPSSLQNSENKKVARLKSTSLICGGHLSNVCAKFELGLFIEPIPTLLFLAIAAIIWKPSSFNDCNDLNTMIAAIVAIVNLVPRVLSPLRESTLVAAGHVSARFLQIPEM